MRKFDRFSAISTPQVQINLMRGKRKVIDGERIEYLGISTRPSEESLFKVYIDVLGEVPQIYLKV